MTPITLASGMPPAALFGTAGLAAQMVAPLFRGSEAILAVQLDPSCAYAACYALMGQDTAAAICLTGASQTAVALLAGRRPWLGRWRWRSGR
ncbi:YgjV family protein [Poseidonocella sp. HB161398]|uniref:YgjV family protein n=1 Tax=Poseidonocella sp. HB161398 TaxID=2320855 RepID=UPI0011081D82|nr:YgjV family protein [Poseidonocella sp. HB161398]